MHQRSDLLGPDTDSPIGGTETWLDLVSSRGPVDDNTTIIQCSQTL